MTYNPPGGVAGHAIAALFGADPKSAMDDDLLKLKSLLEQSAGGSESERYRPAGGMTTTANRARRGGNSGVDAMAAEHHRRELGQRRLGLLRRGRNIPSERKPGSDVPGAGS